MAELADNACWESLIELAQEAGQDEMVRAFEAALLREEQHLARVKGWLKEGVAYQIFDRTGVYCATGPEMPPRLSMASPVKSTFFSGR